MCLEGVGSFIASTDNTGIPCPPRVLLPRYLSISENSALHSVMPFNVAVGHLNSHFGLACIEVVLVNNSLREDLQLLVDTLVSWGSSTTMYLYGGKLHGAMVTLERTKYRQRIRGTECCAGMH